MTLPSHDQLASRVDSIFAGLGVDTRTGDLPSRTPITGGSLGAGGLQLFGDDVASALVVLEAELDQPRPVVRCPGR